MMKNKLRLFACVLLAAMALTAFAALSGGAGSQGDPPTTHHCHPVRGQSPKVCTPHCKFFKNCAKRSRRVPPTKATTRRDSSRSFGMTVGARNDIIIKFGMTNTVILSGAQAQSKNPNEQCAKPNGTPRRARGDNLSNYKSLPTRFIISFLWSIKE